MTGTMSGNARVKDVEAAARAEWKRYGLHLEEFASEFLGTAFLLFCVVGVVVALFAPASPLVSLVPSQAIRLFITGLALGGAGWAVAVSPPGRLSGAHVNPAISVGFFILGKMDIQDAAGYVVSQMAGAIVGAEAGRFAVGRWAAQVNGAALTPSPSVSTGWAFLAEVAATFALAFLIYTFVSHRSLVHWTPAMVTVAVGILVWLDGNISGCGMNPARWFGCAFAAGYWRLYWVYVLGPLAGSVAAASLRRSGLFPHPVPRTGKVLHDPNYRSIFKNDAEPSPARGSRA